MEAVAAHAGGRQAVRHREGQPEVRKEHRFGASEARTSDTKHGHLSTVHLDASPDDAAIASKARSPQWMAQHDHRRFPYPVVLVRIEAASGYKRGTHDVEIVGGHVASE